MTYFKYVLKLFPVLLFVFSARATYAQAPCGTDGLIAELLQQDPNYKNEIDNFNQLLINNPSTGLPGGVPYRIPTVVHVIHQNGPENIDDAQIIDAITQANEQFAGSEGGFDANIELVLAKFDPNGNCTNGITRHFSGFTDDVEQSNASILTLGNIVRWDPARYLNIWIVQDIVNPPTVVGFAHIAPIEPDLDGITITHDFFGRTGTAVGTTVGGDARNVLVHEAGHYLGLYHPWGYDQINVPPGTTPSEAVLIQCEQNCHDTADCSIKGDFVCDTNPCFGAFSNYTSTNMNCDTWLESCQMTLFGTTCEDPPIFPYPKENYMAFTWACHVGFTEEQAEERMWGTLDNFRQLLVSPANAASTIGISIGGDITISSDTDWTVGNLPNNGTVCIDGTVTVESGATLKVEPGVVVIFTPQSTVIVEPNARLQMRKAYKS